MGSFARLRIFPPGSDPIGERLPPKHLGSFGNGRADAPCSEALRNPTRRLIPVKCDRARRNYVYKSEEEIRAK